MRSNVTLAAILLLTSGLATNATGQDCPATVTDIDGNTYPVVQIGDQCWTAENLRTAHYRNGNAIPYATDNSAWSQLNTTSTGASTNYNNDPANDAIYGKLYNGFAVSDGRGLCPQAWHVPTDAEWQTLESALGMPTNELGQTGYRGGAENVGGKLKATVLWNSPNTGATNESGFSAVPGGFLNIGIDNLFHFYFQGDRGGWWSSTNNPAFAKYRELMSAHAGILRSDLPRSYGTCVRCLRDATVGLFEQDPVQFTIAPNPTTSVFTLKLSQPAQAGQVVVLDATGRAVLAQRFNGNGPVTLDLSGHGNGLYVVQVFYPDGTRLTERVVKQ